VLLACAGKQRFPHKAGLPEFANHLQETELNKLAAVIEAASTRLRPILMAAAATVIGHFPLVLAKGPGAGARNSIGIMLVSGMIIGTLFTLGSSTHTCSFVSKRTCAESCRPCAAIKGRENPPPLIGVISGFYLQVSLTIFRLVTPSSEYTSLLEACTTPSRLASAFSCALVSGVRGPATVTV
jgi:hypothetical protein